MVIFVLCVILFAAAIYATNISPSFTMIFMAVNFCLCGLGEAVEAFGRYRSRRNAFADAAGDILFLVGEIFSFPAVFIYAVGDDWLIWWTAGAFLIGTGVTSLIIPGLRKRNMSGGILRGLVLWISFVCAFFALLCGISSAMMLFYGIPLLLLAVLKVFQKRRDMEDKKLPGIRRYWIAFLVVILIAALAFGNSYKIAELCSVLGNGPDFLYENQEKEMTADTEEFLPGARWLDTDGNLIQAHGGQIQRMPVPDGTGGRTEKYVWIGENKSSGHLGNCFAVYSSEDLHSWTFEGDVLQSVDSMEQLCSDPYFTALYADYTDSQLEEVFQCINKNTVMERPKMLYNAGTDKYVLWFHSDDSTEKNSYKYDVGMAGVAISDSPFGPFRFLGRYRLSQCPEGQIDCFPGSKGEARDLNLFQDDDGTAYIVYTSENNKTLYISKLNEEYTYLSSGPETAVYKEDYIRLFPGTMREAPVLIKGDNGRYYLMSSSTTGWMSNQARVWSADEIFGDWGNDGNPCRGSGADVTFDSQSTSIFRTVDGQWIYYGDRWNEDELADSRYVWLPVEFEEDKLSISWEEVWE